MLGGTDHLTVLAITNIRTATMLCLAKEAVFMGAETHHCALGYMYDGRGKRGVMVLLVGISSPTDLQ